MYLSNSPHSSTELKAISDVILWAVKRILLKHSCANGATRLGNDISIISLLLPFIIRTCIQQVSRTITNHGVIGYQCEHGGKQAHRSTQWSHVCGSAKPEISISLWGDAGQRETTQRGWTSRDLFQCSRSCSPHFFVCCFEYYMKCVCQCLIVFSVICASYCIGLLSTCFMFFDETK